MQNSDADPCAPSVLVALLRFVLDVHDADRLIERAATGLSLLPEVLWAQLEDSSSGQPGQLSVTFETDQPDRPARHLTVQLVDERSLETRRAIADILNFLVALHRRQRQADMLDAAAHTDPLTGLWNRRGFIPFVEQAIARSLRSGEGIALLVCDIDNFKRINDTLGHGAGDEALKTVTEVIREAIRPADLAARLGGDELAVLLSNSDALGAMRVAERIRASLRERGALEGHPLTLSIGVADLGIMTGRLRAAGAESEHLFNAADEALYLAKRAGRNRAVCHPDTFAVTVLADSVDENPRHTAYTPANLPQVG